MRYFVLLILLFSNVSSYNIHFNKITHGYENMIVSIHPDIPDTFGDEIIENIKNFISNGSQRLYHATKGYAYIDSVNILLPTTWNGSYHDEISSEYFYEDGAIRINTPNPLYQDTPYTLQLGGCGSLGKSINSFLEKLLIISDIYS